MPAAIELIGITKRFPGVVANDDVNLRVERGEIHAICGENGAGKSTLMKILYGMQPADEGTMMIDGQEVTFSSPTDAIAAGIGMVHQHFMLADQMTVLENVILGSEPTKAGGLIDFDEAERHLREVGEAYGLTVDPNDLVETLEVGEKQRVEIIKVLFRGARILILDEPTAVLVPQEVEELFRNLRELQASGATIIFIDHKLQEVLEISDRITVIRRGKTVTTVESGSVTAADLAELMVGSELPSPETTESTVTDEIALEVIGLTVLDDDRRSVVDNVSLTVHKGEVLGIAGIEGNGQTELIDAIIGTQEMAAGRITLMGEDITTASVRHRREGGIAFVPQDRQTDGLLLDATLWENAALGHQTKRPFSKGWWIDRAGRPAQAHRGDPPGVRRADTGGRRERACAVGRQSAEADHRAASSPPTPSCSSPPTPPAASTSAPRQRSGTTSARHGRRARDPAHLGRPRRADRSVRHDRRALRGARGRHPGAGRGHPPAARLVHDRSADR
jgi:general nucleoside transport system ATP-binding protein